MSLVKIILLLNMLLRAALPIAPETGALSPIHLS